MEQRWQDNVEKRLTKLEEALHEDGLVSAISELSGRVKVAVTVLFILLTAILGTVIADLVRGT